MPVTERQLTAFADTHAWRIPFDTSPRHLAGPGDGRHVTHGLAAAGWTRTSDPLSPEIILTSPEHRHRLQFDPQSATSAGWRLRAEPSDTEPGWYAEFGALVPAEVLGGLTDALIGPTPAQPLDVFTSTHAAGWTADAERTAVSPDGMCRIRHHQTVDRLGAPYWQIETREPGHGTFGGPQIWHAWLDNHTPAHLVAAFVTALTDPGPLPRGMHDRTAHYSARKEPSRLTGQQVADAHTQRVRALRARARAVRRQQNPRSTASPAPPRAPSTASRR